jgi:hypothetical protein
MLLLLFYVFVRAESQDEAGSVICVGAEYETQCGE